MAPNRQRSRLLAHKRRRSATFAQKHKWPALLAHEPKRTLPGLWSQLPIDVLDNIIKRLDLPVDVVSFSAVCKSWRYVALGMHLSLYCKLPMYHAVPKVSPLPMLLHPGCQGPDTHQLYSLNERKRYGEFHLEGLSNKWIAGSGVGWLVTVDTADQAVDLLNPVTGKKIPLPHLSTLPSCDHITYEGESSGFWCLRKVIVCSYQGSLLVVAIVSNRQVIRFCRVGDLKWSRLENSPRAIDDIITCNSKLYAISTWTALFEIHIADAATAIWVAVMPCRPSGEKFYLADLCGELVLLSRMMPKKWKKRFGPITTGFVVYKLVEDGNGCLRRYETEAGKQYPNKKGHSWVQLKNLGHRMVFIGFNHSITLDSRVYPRCKGNCIYFADRRDDYVDYERMRHSVDYERMSAQHERIYHDVGIYHMEKRKVDYLEEFCSASSPMNMMWLSPNFCSELEMHMVPKLSM